MTGRWTRVSSVDFPADAFPIHLWITDGEMTERYAYRFLPGPGGEIDIPSIRHRSVTIVVLYEGHAVMTVNSSHTERRILKVYDIPELKARLEALPFVAILDVTNGVDR